MNKISAIVFAGVSLAFQNGLAGPINFTPVRFDDSNDSQSVSVDAVTGKYYQRLGHGTTGQTFLEFANYIAFEAGLPSQSTTLAEGYFGTYAAAHNGNLFGRSERQTDDSGTGSSRFNLATGAIEWTSAFAGLNGVDGEGTFDWGGLTSMNFYNDASGMYFLGKGTEAGGQTWHLSKVDDNLNILQTKTFASSSLGFATLVNGKLFTGEHYDSAGFDHVFDIATGAYNAVDFSFIPGATHYFDNLVYDVNIDTLYLHNWDDRTFYKLANASIVLDAPITAVPDTASGAGLMGIALGGLLLTSRFLRSAKL